MEITIGAARWVVNRALGPVSDGLLESWAVSSALGPNIRALKLELLYAQGMLDNARGCDIRSSALQQLLLELRQLAYGADDVLDELEYFRIQDELDGTYETTDTTNDSARGGGGLVRGLVLNARHTVRSIAGKLICSCAVASKGSNSDEEEQQQGRLSAATHAIGKHISCCSLPSVDNDAVTGISFCGAWSSSKAPQIETVIVHAPKLMFDRVEMSKRMAHITEKLKPVCSKVATILGLEPLGSSTNTKSLLVRSVTSPAIVEPFLYGRERQKNNALHDIINGKNSENDLTMLPIVGPGGIGKTTFTQHIYEEVKDHFEVMAWICVSQNFNKRKLEQEILKQVCQIVTEIKEGIYREKIEKRVQSKRFFLVFDDMWTYHEDKWKSLLTPFKKNGTKGNMIIVTTRIPEVAKMVGTKDCTIKLERLEPEDFMCLFKVCVFDDKQSWEDNCQLHQVGEQIVDKLKGFPLAAKTVGRLLRNNLTLEHWTRVLESKEWEHHTSDNDIMPALKLSYDFLSFHLQQCFSYCALFPEDYEFKKEELVHLWIGLGLLVGNNGQNKKVEDLGLSYFDDLVNQGFFNMNEKENDGPCYVVHDLLHELAINVSSYECLSIKRSNVRTIQIPASIRHLSINIDNADVDRTSFEIYKRELSALSKRMKAENIHTLMLFGENHGSFYKIFGDLFREAQAIRVIFLFGASYNLEDVFHNFPKLVHLRYLRIIGAPCAEVTLPSSISRFYHLVVLDVQQCSLQYSFPRDMSNLVNIRHFLVPDEYIHSGISEIGKLKYLQELRRFEVKTEIKGFELEQLGKLLELRVSLDICNLEKVEATVTMNETKIENIKHLSRLSLSWDMDRPNKDPTQELRVLESLKPHSNIQELCIRGHGGMTLPTWLGMNISIKGLESLCLEGVAWNRLPLVGDLCMVNNHGGECPGCVTGQGFQNLKRLELVNIPTLKKWHGNGSCHLLSRLEELIIRGCSGLLELPFSQTEQVETMTFFPKLQETEISGCPNLLPLPPFPWTQSLCNARIEEVGPGLELLMYSKDMSLLQINGKDAPGNLFWNLLAFNNLTELQNLYVVKCPPLSLDHLRKLESLEEFIMENSSNALSREDCDNSNVQYELSIENLRINICHASGKELTQLLSHFPKLSKFSISVCKKVTGLGAMEQHQQKKAVPTSPKLACAKTEDAHTQEQQEKKGGGKEMEGAEAADEGLLLLPPQIKELEISNCPELSLCYNSANGNRAARGGRLQGLYSLRSFVLWDCPKFHISNSSSSCYFPFPSSLQELKLHDVKGTDMLGPFSNLTKLEICDCGDLRGQGLLPLIIHGHLTELIIRSTPKFLSGLKQLMLHEQDHHHSSRLQVLRTDDIIGALTAPICDILSSSLIVFDFDSNDDVELLTEEQEVALKSLTSLKEVNFWGYNKLQLLPAGLSTLPGLERLMIAYCPSIMSLPDDSLPSSLQYLEVRNCPNIQSLDCFPMSLQELHIAGCPSISSLPKDRLPNSLRALHVTDCGSVELLRQCRKLKGIIPIIH